MVLSLILAQSVALDRLAHCDIQWARRHTIVKKSEINFKISVYFKSDSKINAYKVGWVEKKIVFLRKGVEFVSYKKRKF